MHNSSVSWSHELYINLSTGKNIQAMTTPLWRGFSVVTKKAPHEFRPNTYCHLGRYGIAILRHAAVKKSCLFA